jgi:hypothetical protein
MFRAAALFLVMALAAGPNVSWVCTVLCDRTQPSSDCRHEEPAASVIAAADTCCEIAAPGVGGFVPQDVRHSGVSVDTDRSSPVLHSTFVDSLTEGRRGTGQAPASAQNRHSLSAALRL